MDGLLRAPLRRLQTGCGRDFRSPDSSTASAMFRPKPLALPVTNHTLSINTSLCCLVNRSFELCPQLGGGRPFPRSESSIKGIRILVAEQVRHLSDIDIRPVEILSP